jgi:hypothetical protein
MQKTHKRKNMRDRVFSPGLFFLLLALLVSMPASASNPLDEDHALNLLVAQIQKDKLYDSWTSLACLSFVTEEKTKKFIEFAILEKHGGKCPGDPNTSPVVDRFKVNRFTHKIEWFEPIEGELKPYRAVLKFRLEK